MADQKISELLNGGLPTAGDKFLIARDGDNYSIDGSALATAADISGLSSDIDAVSVIANRADGQATAAYTLAGDAFDQANAAHGQADTATSAADAAYTLAGTALDQANAAGTAASDASTLAGSAHDRADAAYAQANSATTAATTASSSVGAAYNQANAALSMAQSVNGIASKTAPPPVYLSGASTNGFFSYRMLPNSIPASTASATFRVDANSTRTWASCFYASRNIEVRSIDMYAASTGGGSRFINWQIWGVKPDERKFTSVYYGGKSIEIQSAGPVKDSVYGVLPPGWYAIVLSVGSGSGALLMYGIPAFAQHVHGYWDTNNMAITTGLFDLGANYFPPNSTFVPTAPWTPDNRPCQIPLNWYHTDGPVVTLG